MREFFAGTDYTGEPFHFLGPAHLITLGIIIGINLALISLRVHSNERLRSRFRYGLAILLLVNETAYHLWRWMTGQWTIQIMLPLHLCAVMVYLSAIMLITKSYPLYQFLYFMGIGAATQALFTPPDALTYGFPHFRFFQSFISHGTIVTSAIYMTIIEQYRPYWKSILRVVIWLNIYMVFVGIVNTLIGSNYLYIAHKPEIPTLLDVLGPWPIYIFWMEAIGFFVCLLLYLPFAILDWKKGPQGIEQ